MPELLGRREISLSLQLGTTSTDRKVRTYERVFFTDRHYKNTDSPQSRRFIHESLFHTQSVMLSPRFITCPCLYPVRSPCFILTGNLCFWVV